MVERRSRGRRKGREGREEEGERGGNKDEEFG